MEAFGSQKLTLMDRCGRTADYPFHAPLEAVPSSLTLIQIIITMRQPVTTQRLQPRELRASLRTSSPPLQCTITQSRKNPTHYSWL